MGGGGKGNTWEVLGDPGQGKKGRMLLCSLVHGSSSRVGEVG